MNSETTEIMRKLGGISFRAQGPFLVADLTTEPVLFESLAVGRHGMESVPQGKRTEPHEHDFPSFYKSEGLDVEVGGERVKLPERALTLVLPGTAHSWVPKQELGSVGSLDDRHEMQKVLALAA